MEEKKRATLTQRLAWVQTQLKAPKDQYNQFGKYSYRTAAGILQAAKPLISQPGIDLMITLSDEMLEVGGRVYLKATAAAVDIFTGEKIEVTGMAREDETKAGMAGAQITGSCSSYARKYALCGLLMIDDSSLDPDNGKA